MTPPRFFLVLLLKHAGGNKRKVIHIKRHTPAAEPSAPRCGDKFMAARRESAYGPTASKLQGAALSKPETVPAQEHHATGGAPDGY